MTRPLHNVVVFSVAGRSYAIELRWVREVVTLGHVTPMPRAPAGIAGLVNSRGAILPVLDLPTLLGVANHAAGAAAGDSAILLEVEAMRAALRVEMIDEVSSLRPAPGDASLLLDSRQREVELLSPPRLFERAQAATDAAARDAVAGATEA